MAKKNILQRLWKHALFFAMSIAIFFAAINSHNKNHTAENNKIDSIGSAENPQDHIQNHTSSKNATDDSTNGIESNNISSVTSIKKNHTPITQKEIISPENETHLQHSTESAAPTPEITRKHFDNPWQSYSDQMPKVSKGFKRKNPGTDYAGDDIEHFKKLADEGDLIAKFMYADRVAALLTAQFKADYEHNDEAINVALWTSRFDEVRAIFIECAVKGMPTALQRLLNLYPPQLIVDRVESIIELLSWALIEDAMLAEEIPFYGEGEPVLHFVCRTAPEPCTNELLTKGLERAKFYLDFYEFKTTQKSITSGNK